MKQKKLASVILIAVALLISQPTYAMKAFGWEVTSQVSYISGGCTYISTAETYYFFGLALDTRTTNTLVGCDSTPTPCYPDPCPDGPPY